MRLSQYLRDGLVVHGLEISGMKDALEAFGKILETSGFVSSREGVVNALRKREEMHTTVLGDGVAVPHATIPDISDVHLMVVSTSSPISFGPADVEPVDLFFVLVSPPGREGEHIKILARICRLVRDPESLERLKDAEDSKGLRRAVLSIDSQHV